MKKIILLVLILSFGLIVGTSFAAPLDVFDGWKMIADDDGFDSNGYVNPGWGGQDFDAEYLFYKLNGSTLSIGLQTGFDVEHGVLNHGGTNYYAGDLALSFDGDVVLGDSSTYEYAFDFGFASTLPLYGSEDYSGDSAGLYAVSCWNKDGFKQSIHFDGSNPFAMETGTVVDGSDGATTYGSDIVGNELSYYRIASFDLSSIAVTGDLDVHWTMSCGNDAIDGSAPVPEPATLILLGSGLAGLAFYRRKKK